MFQVANSKQLTADSPNVRVEDRFFNTIAQIVNLKTPAVAVHCLLFAVLQIRQPPIAAARFHSGKPFAQRIKQYYANEPAGINHREVETHPRRWRFNSNQAAKHPAPGFAGSGVNNNCDQMCSRPLQKVEEKRHASKGHEEVSQAALGQ